MTTALEAKTTGVSRPESDAAPRPYHWTVEAFYRAFEAGVFGPDARLELIHGRIIEKMPPSPLHTSISNIIADLLRAALPALTVRVEGAVHIEFDGEPIPDVSAVIGTNRDYLARHPVPAEVALLVEVAISSAEYDLGEKALLYAQAGIADYWVALLGENAVVVHRDPTPEGYGSVVRLHADAAISPLAAQEAVLPVRELFAH